MAQTIALIGLVVLLTCAQGVCQEPAESYDVTSRGVIASAAEQTYQHAIDSCSAGDVGKVGTAAFAVCVRSQARAQLQTLERVYTGAVDDLKSKPKLAMQLRNAHRAWLQFRDANCAFAKAIAPPEVSEEYFSDCLLRSAVDRAAELRSLIGD